MNRQAFEYQLCKAAVLAVAFGWTTHAAALDADGVQSLMRKSDCFKCHAVDKKKDGPMYKEVAAKYKGKPDAEQKLHTHLTTNPKVEVDGKKEEHASLKTKNDADVKDVIKWILSR